MSGFIEKITDVIFGLMNGCESVRARRTDDPLTAEHKRLQRAAIASLAYLLGALIIAFGAVAVLSSVEENAILGPLVAGVRAPLGNVVTGALVLTLLYVVFAWGALYRFIRKHIED